MARQPWGHAFIDRFSHPVGSLSDSTHNPDSKISRYISSQETDREATHTTTTNGKHIQVCVCTGTPSASGAAPL